jgi:hypothetical protein
MPGISFTSEPVFANSLGDIANAFATGPMRQLQAQQTMQDIIMKGLERQRLEDQIRTGNAAGAATQAVFQGQINPSPNAADATGGGQTTTSNVWGDTTPAAAPTGGVAPNAPPPVKNNPMAAAYTEMYRAQIEAARAKGDLAELRRLAAEGPMFVTGQTPQDFQTRERMKISGVPIDITPTGPATSDEAARAVLTGAERQFATNPQTQLTRGQATDVLLAGNRVNPAETSFDPATGTSTTLRKVQPWSPAVAAELARHGLVMTGTGTGVPAPGATVPGAAPAPGGLPPAPTAAAGSPVVTEQFSESAPYKHRDVVAKTQSYQDAQTAHDAAKSVIDAYGTPLPPDTPEFFRDTAAATNLRAAIVSHIQKIPALGTGPGDLSASQSYLANVSDLLKQATNGKALSPEQRRGMADTALMMAANANNSYEAEHGARRSLFESKMPGSGDIAVPRFGLNAPPDWRAFGVIPKAGAQDARRRMGIGVQ